MAPSATDTTLGALTYRGLRRSIGVVASALPFVLVGFFLLRGGGDWPASISDYYYTSSRNLLVGILCALGVFLFSYRYRRRDNWLSSIAAACVIGVALFPTAQPGAAVDRGEAWVYAVHLASAVSFFLLLAWFSLRLFTLHGERMTDRKRLRNRVYVVCGVAILVFLGLAGLDGVLAWAVDGYDLDRYNPVFWLESLAVWSFAVSWLVKGGFFLADLPAGDPVAP